MSGFAPIADVAPHCGELRVWANSGPLHCGNPGRDLSIRRRRHRSEI